MTTQTESKTALTLTGNRNQCTGCNEYFNHDYGFDRHRIGKHRGNQRRCMSVAEMVKKGFSKNARGSGSLSRRPRREWHQQGEAIRVQGPRRAKRIPE